MTINRRAIVAVAAYCAVVFGGTGLVIWAWHETAWQEIKQEPQP